MTRNPAFLKPLTEHAVVSLAPMELGHGRIYKVIGRRLHGSDPAPDPETFEGCVYKGRTEWSAEGQPMDAFWSPDVGHFLFFKPGTYDAEERFG